MNYFNILHTFLFGPNICALFFRLGRIDRVSHFCPMSKKMYQHLWYQLKVTIKDCNLDAYYFISVKYEMYDKALRFYFIPRFEQFTTFFSEYQQDLSLMLILYVISAPTKMTLTTEEVITATSKII